MTLALLLSGLVVAASPVADASKPAETTKKTAYLATKRAPKPSDCCAPGIHLPTRTCAAEPACRGPARAGTVADEPIYARNLWTEEIMLWTGPVVLDRAQLGSFLRCYSTGEPGEHPPELIERVITTAVAFKVRKINIISAFRHPKHNWSLVKKGREVARSSEHTRHQAIDFNLPGVSTEKLYRYLLKAHRGGVGYYPVSSFVHVDIGKKRTWKGT